MGLFIKILTGDNLSSPRYNVTLEITLAPALSPSHKLRAKIIPLPMVHLGLIPSNAFYQSCIYFCFSIYSQSSGAWYDCAILSYPKDIILLTFRHVLIQVRVRLIRDRAESVGVMLL